MKEERSDVIRFSIKAVFGIGALVAVLRLGSPSGWREWVALVTEVLAVLLVIVTILHYRLKRKGVIRDLRREFDERNTD